MRLDLHFSDATAAVQSLHGMCVKSSPRRYLWFNYGTADSDVVI